MTDSSGQIRKEQVVRIVNSVINKIETVEHESLETVRHELHALKEVINGIKGEIAGNGSGVALPDATDELDAVISGTAEATSTIMDSCEKIENILEDFTSQIPEEAKNSIQDKITAIYEACSFQDITGQRVTKVINAIKQIDQKVDHILEHDKVAHSLELGKPTEEIDEKSLMNGPQLPGNAISQEEIDKLLEQFD